MTLKELINEYDATGFVLQERVYGKPATAGGFINVKDGSPDDELAILAEYGDIELYALETDHISKYGDHISYASDWIAEPDRMVRVFF